MSNIALCPNEKISIERLSHFIVNLIGCWMILLGQGSLFIYLPSFLLMQHDFNTTHHGIALSITYYMFGYGASMLLWGALSESLGRKKVLLIGLIVLVASSIGIAFTHSLEAFLLLRLLQGIGGGCGTTVSRAAIRDVFEGSALAKAISYTAIAFVAALGIAPFLGSLIQTYLNWRYQFWLLALLGIFAAITILFYFPETKSTAVKQASLHPIKIIKQYLKLLSLRDFIVPTLGGGLIYGIIIAYNTINPYLFEKTLGISPIEYGHIALFNALAYLVGALITNRLVTHFGIKKIIRIGFFTIFSAIWVLWVFQLLSTINIFLIVLPMSVIIAGQAMIFGNAMSLTLHSFKEVAGYAAALFGCLQQVICSGLAFAVSFAPYKSDFPLVMIITIIALSAFLLLFKKIRD